MKRIGLIGEDPNDTSSIKNLLSTKYGKKFIFQPMLKNIRGYQLDSVRFNTKLRAEIKASKTKFKHFIYVRDLDGLPSSKIAIHKKQEWYDKLNREFDNGIFLLNIYELEALILADIENFNRLFKANVTFKGNPMMKEKPKEFLMHHTKTNQRKYLEHDAPEIFNKLDFDMVKSKCRYFGEFIEEFEKMIA
jgi:hypothetical protein